MARARWHLRIPALLALLLLPGTARAEEPAKPWPGSWLGHTGSRIGVMVSSLTPELREHFGVDRSRGVLVARVEPDSPASHAGIRVGDIVVEANGRPVTSPHELIREVQSTSEGDSLALLLFRGGHEQRVELVPEPFVRPPGWGLANPRPRLKRALDELRQQMLQLQRRVRELEEHLVPRLGEAGEPQG